MPMKHPIIRVHKGEQFPLFSCITTEISAQCNRTCVFCPNHDFVRPKELMPLEMIEHVMSQLRDLKWVGSWQPYMYNEPLKDKRVFDIMRMVRSYVPRVIINIATNADYLTEDKLDQLVDAGVNQMAINVYSSRDGSDSKEARKKGVQLSKERAALLQSWLDKRPHIDQTRSLYNGGSNRRVTMRVQHKYGVKKNGSSFGGQFPIANRSGNVEWLNDREGKQGVCTSPMRIMEINWKGDVVQCCHDYNGAHPVANVMSTSILDIWNGKALHKIRSELQDGVRKGPLCGNCDFNGGHYKHMISRVELTPLTRRKA